MKKLPKLHFNRTLALRIGLLVMLVFFGVKLYYLQVIKHDYYVAEARKLQVSKEMILPKRGEIYGEDRGQPVPLVTNEAVYTVIADPHNVTHPDKVEVMIRRLAGGEAVKDFSGLSNKNARYMILAKQVTRTQADLIKKENLNGVGLQPTTRRVYPEGALAAQVLGYVNADGVGQYGVEGYLQDELVGVPGMLQTITDVRRIPLTIGGESVKTPAKDGQNIVLTMDRNIQAKAEQALKAGLDNVKATKGSVVIMDPNNGAILAMANYPSFDPANYSRVENYEDFQNKTVTYPYEAGSVVKTLTMAAGLDSGAVTSATTYNNTGFIKVDDRVIKNVEEDPINPRATMQDILKYSLNTGVVTILKRMGGGEVNQQARDKLYNYFYNKYYFGQKTGIEQEGEARGEIYAPKSEQGNNVRYANMAFGQGMTMTTLQMAAAFSSIINGGIYYQPHIVAGSLDNNDKFTAKNYQPKNVNVVSPNTSSEVTEMIHQARAGSSFSGKGNDRAGYYIGGKTGTAQVIDPKTGEYSDDNAVGSYIGFGGTSKPEYVIMVRVDDSKMPGYAGGVAAAPIFGDLSNWMINYLRLPPQ
jgi:cell division protein FtsI (penicillin-binding protein 3)